MCQPVAECPLETSTRRQTYMTRYPAQVDRKRKLINQSYPGQSQVKKAKRRLIDLRRRNAPEAEIESAEDTLEDLQAKRRKFWHPIMAKWIDERIAASSADFGPDINPIAVATGASERRKRQEELRASGQLKTADEINAEAEARLRAEGVIDPDETFEDFRANSYFYRKRAQQRKIDAASEQARRESKSRANERRKLLVAESRRILAMSPEEREAFESFDMYEEEWFRRRSDDPISTLDLLFESEGKTYDDLR